MSYTFYHSFWSKPMTEISRWGYNNTIIKNAWYFAWSVLSLKKHIPDAKINLHTDEYGSVLLQNIPYDNILIDLEGIRDNKYLWAAGKIKALSEEELGAIHIDGDVIISSDEFLNKPQFSNADIIVQSLEPVLYFKETEYAKILLRELCQDYFESSACNCGLVQINNQELKDEYIRRYYFLASKLERQKNIFDTINERNKHLTFDLLFEQASLFKACKDGAYKLKVLANNNHQASVILPQFGYTHFIGSQKYSEENLAKARAAVKELNEDVYNYLTELESGTE